MKNRIALNTIVSLFLAISLQTVIAQGPLTPPGAPAPTMKTLAQVEPRTAITNLPYTITASGSYYVTTNLTPAANQNGIVIAADNVTIDLEGFELVGGGGGSGEGISASGARANIVIRNGTVRNWPGSGINLYDSVSSRAFVQGIRALTNGFTGIAIRNGSRAVDCLAAGNGAKGILVDADCLVEHCKAASNATDGIAAGATSQIANNQCTGNGLGGGYNGGIHLTGANNLVQANQVTGNARGLAVEAAGNIVANNIVKGNTDNYDFVPGNQLDLLVCEIPESIDWSAKVKLAGSLTGVVGQNGINITTSGVTVDLNGFELAGVVGALSGVVVSSGQTNILVRNGTVRNWPTYGVDAASAANSQFEQLRVSKNGSAGLRLGVGSTAINCTAYGNGDGISAGNGSIVRDCVTSSNLGNGIVAGPTSRLTDNLCVLNGANGISAASGSLINGCMGNSNSVSGISVGTGSSISGCIASGNIGGDGIVVSNNCRVVDNVCDGNAAGAGIHATGNGNRIDGNHVSTNNRAIIVDGGENLITRNTTLNTFFVFANNNHWGPIIYLAPAGALPFTGNSSAGNLSTTDPWANFDQ